MISVNQNKIDSIMKASEIAEDKQYLADTDWIVAKIGEASVTGQDTAPLLEQYAIQLQARERVLVFAFASMKVESNGSPVRFSNGIC